MIWLELRTNNKNYLSGWNFAESVWAPIKKANGSEWPFWSIVSHIVAGDIVFHLQEIKGKRFFTGYSTALTDGYITYENPALNRHAWDFSKAYYRADLANFQKLNPVVPLSDFFRLNDSELRDIFTANKKLRKKNKKLFYVIQRNNLQCLNGAYFSEFDQRLSELLIGKAEQTNQVHEPRIAGYTTTGVSYGTLARRIGQQQFSDNVKRNFNHQCCFPNCKSQGDGFLVSGHIARWADNAYLRGNTDNGLCLCLMHDKAFEKGFFTLDSNFRIKLLILRNKSDEWLFDFLKEGEGQEIKPRQINPSIKALELHWDRVGYKA